MSFLRSSKLNFFKKWMSEPLGLSNKKKHSLLFLNLAQFFGVINDNIFKFVMAFLLIDALGAHRASEILSATGAIYVIPFLLFSSSAGILADRFSKQKLLTLMKGAEIIIMSLALFAFYYKTVWGCYSLLFLLSTHSAMFGPSKYGIIPELVPSYKVSKANGLITSFTYLAIIIGTFLASFLTEITNRQFIFIAGFCLLIAIAGFVSALGVKHTSAQAPQKKLNLFFIREIYRTLLSCKEQKHLLPSIFGSAYFLFIGAFTQLNIIPFAMESLHFNEVAGGYLFLSTALGIALGSFIAGKISKKQIELGISCLAGFGIALFFFLLPIFSNQLIPVIISLIGIGVLGGIFIVPFDTFIQLHSENKLRGQTIAAANFLSFFGVLIASIALFLLTQALNFSSAMSFGVIGFITLAVSIALTFRLSDLSIPFFSRYILFPLFRFTPPAPSAIKLHPNTILVLEKGKWKDALLLLGTIPNIHLLIPINKTKPSSWLLRYFYSFHCIPTEDDFNQLLISAQKHLQAGVIPCLFLENYSSPVIAKSLPSFLHFFKLKSTPIHIFPVSIGKKPVDPGITLNIKTH